MEKALRVVLPIALLLCSVMFSSPLVAQEGTTVWEAGKDYEVSQDGKTLTGWKRDNVELLDMNSDATLAKVEKIANRAFIFKTIGKILVGDNVKTIEKEAFISCYVTELTLGKNTSVIDGAFYKIGKALTVKVPLGNSAFVLDGDALYTADHKKLVWNIGLNGSKRLTLHENTIEIAYGAFWKSEKLETIVFPSSLETIGDYAFRGAGAIRKLVFGDKLKSVGAGAFSGCHRLYQIDIAAPQVPTTGAGIFEETPDGTLEKMQLHVPEALISAYRANAEWSRIGSISALVGQIPTHAYELSADGKTLVKWREPMTNIDMARDTQLAEVEVIGEGAFLEVGGLVENIILPAKLKRIEKQAFYTCAGITYMPLPETLDYIGDQAFAQMISYSDGMRIVLPKALKEIGTEAFYGVPASRVEIPASVEKIGANAFSRMKKLVAFVVAEENPHFTQRYGILLTKDLKTLLSCPQNKYTGDYDLSREGFNGLEEIADGAFVAQESLKGIKFPETLKKIGDYAFSGIESLLSVELPASLETLGKQAFYNTVQLEKITVAPENKFFAVEDNVLYNKDKTIALQGAGDYKYRNFALPETVREIAPGAFAHHFWLYSIVLPEGLTKIGEYAFFSCSSLSAVDMPATTTTIETAAFSSCKKLTKVICRAEKVPTMADNAFSYIAEGDEVKSALYVPDASCVLYANETACKVFDDILPLSQLTAIPSALPVDYRLALCEGGLEISGLAAGSVATLYTIAGEVVARVVASDTGALSMPAPAGSYILLVDGAATKVIIK